MADNKNTNNLKNFRINRIKDIKEMYASEESSRRRYDRTYSYSAGDYTTAKAVRQALIDSVTNKDAVVDASRKMFQTSPIYAYLVNYLSNLFMWRYKVLPHRVYSKSKAKARKVINTEDYGIIYNAMLEVVDGLSIETKFPSILAKLVVEGSVYITAFPDDESLTINTLLLPSKYCHQIGETQYGTSLINFDFSYFTTLGLTEEQLKDYFASFPKEFQKKYNAYKKDSKKRWQLLDPHYSTAIMWNQQGIPNFFYLYGSILNYEQYQDNELERNGNLLKYLIVHTMPHYEDKLIFEMDEVKEIHKSIKKIVETGDKARLITTYGDVHVDQIAKNDTTENKALTQAFNTIFSNFGMNYNLFTGETSDALKISLNRDKTIMWSYIQKLINFYTIAINNCFDFKNYQVDIEILPISLYTYSDDIKVYKDNATLGVGKLDYFVASGIKQKNIKDTFDLESYLKFDSIKPMQTSYTQSAEVTSTSEETSTPIEESDPSETSDQEVSGSKE